MLMEGKIQPSGEQRRIIESKGNSIVVSNPGTGKTTTLALKVVQLLEEGVDPEDILCITFTRKARREMQEAISRQGGGRFAAQVKRVRIHTFHSFAFGHLIDAGRVDATAVDENLVRHAVYKSFKGAGALNYDKKYIIGEIVPAAANAIIYIKNFGITPDRIDVPGASKIVEELHKDAGRNSTYTAGELKAFLAYLTDAYGAYEGSKNDAADYTDILIKFLEVLDGPLFGHALIDEMQDMNAMQVEIARRVSENVFLVGDEKQAIFGFQGGSTEHLKSFEGRCEKMLLSANRRSTNQILDYARRYYVERTQPDKETAKSLEGFRSDKSGEIPRVISTGAPIANVLKLIGENPGRSIGVIARTNGQVARISGALTARDIPHESTMPGVTADRARRHITDFLKGQLHDGVAHKIRAALTVLSPYPLDEALGLAEMLEGDGDDPGLDGLKSWGCGMTAAELDGLCQDHTSDLRGPRPRVVLHGHVDKAQHRPVLVDRAAHARGAFRVPGHMRGAGDMAGGQG